MTGSRTEKAYIETVMLVNDGDLSGILMTRSISGGAWVASAVPFSPLVKLYRFESPSRVPDHFYDLATRSFGGKPVMGWKGSLRGFTEAAIIRDQNRGLGQA